MNIQSQMACWLANMKNGWSHMVSYFGRNMYFQYCMLFVALSIVCHFGRHGYSWYCMLFLSLSLVCTCKEQAGGDKHEMFLLCVSFLDTNTEVYSSKREKRPARYNQGGAGYKNNKQMKKSRIFKNVKSRWWYRHQWCRHQWCIGHWYHLIMTIPS